MGYSKKRKNGYSQKYNSKSKFRSGLEESVAGFLKKHQIEYDYEREKINYVQPEKKRTYLPDFFLPNGVIIEVKGRWKPEDRIRFLWIRESNPGIDIRFVFSNANQKLRKGAKSTYGQWCSKNGFNFASKQIPLSWAREKPKKKPDFFE